MAAGSRATSDPLAAAISSAAARTSDDVRNEFGSKAALRCWTPGAPVLAIEPATRSIWWSGEPICRFRTGSVQFGLLHRIAQGPENRGDLYEAVWDKSYGVSADNVLYVAIARLRKRLERIELTIEASPDGYVLSPECSVVELREAESQPIPVSTRPQPVTRFIGRQAELARLNELYASHTLVSILGPGGAGKTRLVQQFLASRNTHSVTVWLEDLQADELWAALARALGANAPDAESIRQTLRATRPFVVLDNAEHIVADVAKLVEQLRAIDPTLPILVTSRLALGLRGEHRISLAGLPSAEAAELFVELAEQGGVFCHDAREIVDQIVDGVAGMPLPLELAAARAGPLGLSTVYNRLLSPKRLAAASAASDLPARHRSVHATLMWSWDLLSAAERRALCQTALFDDGAPIDALEVVIDGDEPLMTLAHLAEHHLVRIDDDRVSLQPLVREFGLSMEAKVGGLNASRDAHANWYLEQVNQLDSRRLDHVARRAWLRTEHQNLLRSADWTHTTDPTASATLVMAVLPYMRGHGVAEELRLLERVDVAQLDNELAIDVLLSLEMAHSNAGSTASGKQFAKRALQLAGEDERLQSICAARSQQKQPDAVLERAAELLGPQDGNAWVLLLNKRAGARYALREFDSAIDHYQRAVEAARTIPAADPAVVLHNMAFAQLSTNQIDRARNTAEEGVVWAEWLDDFRILYCLHLLLSLIEGADHAFDESLAHANRAVRLSSRNGIAFGVQRSTIRRAQARLQSGDVDGAEADFRGVLAGSIAADTKSHVAEFGLAMVALERGNLDEVGDRLDMLGSRNEQANAQLLYALVDALKGKRAEAIERLLGAPEPIPLSTGTSIPIVLALLQGGLHTLAERPEQPKLVEAIEQAADKPWAARIYRRLL